MVNFLTLDDPGRTDVLITKETNSVLLFYLKHPYIDFKIITCISLALLNTPKEEKSENSTKRARHRNVREGHVTKPPTLFLCPTNFQEHRNVICCSTLKLQRYRFI